jgi:hypothetical protein
MTETLPASRPTAKPARASQPAYFTASGSTAEPAGCIFNSQVGTG